VLGLDLLGGGLVEDGPHQRRHPRLRGLGHAGEQVAQVVGAAPLPRGPGQCRSDRLDQPGVRVGDDQLDAGQTAGDQAAQERHPAGAVLGRTHLDPEDLAVPVGVHTGGHQHVHIDDAAALTNLLRQGVDPHERIRPALQRPVAERGDLGVQHFGHL
jgi:hypothetical protein